MNKLIPVILIFFLFTTLFGCTVSVNPQDLAPSKKYTLDTNTGTNLDSNSLGTVQTNLSLTASEVAKHNVMGNCWMILNGNVYDLTDYVAHPGGSGYLKYCGTDGSNPYNTKDGRGNNHSNYADVLLANFLVGKVGQEIVVNDKNSIVDTNSNILPDVNVPNNNIDNNVLPKPIQVSLTLNEVSKHSVSGNCWMVINGKVYDLSEYVSHPGGSGYLIYCGKDSTSGYDTKGGRGSSHSSFADSLLSNYLIGSLGQNVLVSDINTSPNPTLPPYNGDDDDEYEDD